MLFEEKIKEIIYQNSYQSGYVCENVEDGQVLGLRTGKGLELDVIAQKLLNELSPPPNQITT